MLQWNRVKICWFQTKTRLVSIISWRIMFMPQREITVEFPKIRTRCKHMTAGESFSIQVYGPNSAKLIWYGIKQSPVKSTDFISSQVWKKPLNCIYIYTLLRFFVCQKTMTSWPPAWKSHCEAVWIGETRVIFPLSFKGFLLPYRSLK